MKVVGYNFKEVNRAAKTSGNVKKKKIIITESSYRKQHKIDSTKIIMM